MTKKIPILDDFDYTVDFGKFVKERRKDIGLLQKELANKLNLTNQAMCMIEGGQINPSIVTLRNLAVALDVHYFHLRQLQKYAKIKKKAMK